MMEAASTSETLINFCQTTRRYNPEDSHLLRIWSISWASSIQSKLLQSISLIYILVLFSHLLFGLPTGLCLLVLRLKFFVYFSSYHAPPIFIIILNFIDLISGEQCKLWSFSLCIFLLPHATSPLLVYIIFPDCVPWHLQSSVAFKWRTLCACLGNVRRG
jgi:hypothetical protein